MLTYASAANTLQVRKRLTSAQIIILGFSNVILLGALMLVGGALVISIAEGLPMYLCLFETASAIGTVGLALGVTPELGALSRLILIGLMFFGRVGGLTLIFAALSGAKKTGSKLPQEKNNRGIRSRNDEIHSFDRPGPVWLSSPLPQLQRQLERDLESLLPQYAHPLLRRGD